MKQLLLLFTIISLSSCKEKFSEVIFEDKFILIQKQYIPDNINLDVGYSTSGNMVFTPSGSKERFFNILMLKKTTIPFEAKDMYVKYQINDTINIKYLKSLESSNIEILSYD